ncbi:MAG: alkaline shock response membrane anchor protein AmaP [Myxococcota bacterium]|nr:alkaline shock response membrane anchor protein AmaP [Myxococcota bacterium]
MTHINRILASVLLLILVLGVLLAIALSLGATSLDLGLVDEKLRALAHLSAVERGVFSSIGAVFVLFLLSVVLLIWRPVPRRARPFPVEIADHGWVSIERESVCKLAERLVLAMQTVRNVRASVRDGNAGLVLRCEVVVDPTANIPELGAQVQRELKLRIEEQLGLRVEDVYARFRFVPYRPEERALL